MEKKVIIISIESRKGGVGKTTAALNLAKLLSRKLPVLLIDADVTGTNTAEAIKDSFWSNYANVVKYKDEPLNLLELFSDIFLTGGQVPAFSEYSSEESLLLERGKFNIIGSQIYKDDNSKNKLLCPPSILFDELHSFWLSEFFMELAEKFYSFQKKPCVIIVDNSPGFVGIGPAVQNWLIDIGPKNGKFLFVSSIDKQDIRACNFAIEEVLHNYENRLTAAEIFHDLRKNPVLNDETERELIHIADSAANNSNSDLVFYTVKNNCKQGNDYLVNPGKFISVLINKIPKVFPSDNITKVAQSLFPKPDDSIFCKLAQLSATDPKKLHLIEYDKRIEQQFVSLPGTENKAVYLTEPEHESISKFLEITKVPYLTESYFSQSLTSGKFGKMVDTFNDLIDYLINLNGHLKSNKTLSATFTQVSDLLGEISDFEWAFSFIQDHFYWPTDDITHVSEPTEYDFSSFYSGLKKRVSNILKKIGYDSDKDKDIINKLLAPAVIMLSRCLKYFHNAEAGERFAQLMSVVISIETVKIGNSKNRNISNLAHRDFSNIQDEYYKVYMYYPKIYILGLDVFEKFYFAFNKFQLRVIYLSKDVRFINDIIKYYLQNSNRDSQFSAAISQIADDVLKYKSITHEEGMNKFTAFKDEIMESEEFENKLNEIISGWQIC